MNVLLAAQVHPDVRREPRVLRLGRLLQTGLNQPLPTGSGSQLLGYRQTTHRHALLQLLLGDAKATNWSSAEGRLELAWRIERLLLSLRRSLLRRLHQPLQVSGGKAHTHHVVRQLIPLDTPHKVPGDVPLLPVDANGTNGPHPGPWLHPDQRAELRDGSIQPGVQRVGRDAARDLGAGHWSHSHLRGAVARRRVLCGAYQGG
mmetsp:Transcript_28043/g.72514  ORF Transcript_28043/g.72514 Transcript_28043/m.72514 type:complete len:203 (+) Transcript_28043:253-861(+)